MTQPREEIDALRIYRTIRAGDGSPGSAQPDPSLSLGGGWSSTLAMRPGFLVDGVSIPGVRIEDLIGPIGAGGQIRAVSADQLALTLPGESEGAAVTIEQGQSRLLKSGNGYARVRRELGEDLADDVVMRVATPINNILAMENLADADRQAGLTVYRLAMISNVNTSKTLRNIQLWFTSNPGSRWAMALEAPANDGTIQEIADEETAPSGVTFHQPSSAGSDIKIDTLDPQDNYGLLFRRTTPSPDSAAVEVTATVAAKFQIQTLT